ncbi:hypothetical protein BCE75_107125 [Isoptericola sp. CG 20/1183]|uniref:Uncharacterized protein n=1 Tax=Isoptericola halotolerans TaxID=300560 RepID=A0ABX5EGT9_9MICO|nr:MULTISPECIES: hypothetical protein [Isoptericola]MCK0116672.1 hypothetical protein [Isoptericola sp. S6320L]PRZ05638.1 hypothetical protein BCL65_107125 [Isoptericola halotolerans]PRZ06206.1 hypothetical protein BCE75_107125 [Isoptericola sp. CG 20/1183]
MGQVGRGAGAIVTDYFAAPTDALAATVARQPDGPSSAARGSGEALFDTVRMPSVDPFVMLGTLAGHLCRRPYGEVTGNPRHGIVLTGGAEGPWVATVSDVVAVELAAASPEHLADVAVLAAGPTGPVGAGADDLATALRELGELAARALAVRHALYCWTVLTDEVSRAG